MKNQNDIPTEPLERRRDEESGTWKRDKKKLVAWITGLSGMGILSVFGFCLNEWQDVRKNVADNSKEVIALKIELNALREASKESNQKTDSALVRLEAKIDTLLLEKRHD